MFIWTTLIQIGIIGFALLPPKTFPSRPPMVEILQVVETTKTSLPDPDIKLSSKELSIPSQADSSSDIPWGQTEKIGDHLYRTYVGNDTSMASPSEILTALNKYRQDHGRGQLQSDDKLCEFAAHRAAEQSSGLDSHAGFKKYFENPDHWQDLGVTSAGENASYGYILSGTHLVEWVFNADDEHRDNQLNPDWTLSCAAVAGKTVDMIFAKR